MINAMRVAEHKEKYSKKLSGGTKRKVSYRMERGCFMVGHTTRLLAILLSYNDPWQFVLTHMCLYHRTVEFAAGKRPVVLVVCIRSHNWSSRQWHYRLQCSLDKPPCSLVCGQDSTMCDIVWVSPQEH